MITKTVTPTTVTLTVDAKTFNIVAQLAHVAGGLAVVWGSAYFWGLKGAEIGVGVLSIVAAVKEFWYDYHYETVAERGSSLLDFVMYHVGSLTALATVFLKILLTHKG